MRDPGAPAAPSRALSVDQVVTAQLAGLQREPRSGSGAGVGARTCWEFASHGNRVATGPVDRFADLLRSPAYVGLLEHQTVHVGSALVEGDQARIEVLVLTADDRTEGYTWVLARGSEPPYEGCWMTDGVLRHGDGLDR